MAAAAKIFGIKPKGEKAPVEEEEEEPLRVKLDNYLNLSVKVLMALLILPSLLAVILVHGPQYRLLAGEMVASGFLGEIISVISLCTLTYLYK